MAVETSDYRSAVEFVRRAKIRDCYLPSPEAPDPLQDEQQLPQLIPYLGLGLKIGPGGGPDPPQAATGYRVYATGWMELEGVMILQPELDFPADLHASVSATNERALRDLLMAFPPSQTGFFYVAAEWMLGPLSEFFEGRVMPSREGYFATSGTFGPQQAHVAGRVSAADYDRVRGQWSEAVWNDMMADGYAVHACHVDMELCAVCFHWPVAPWRHEVHGLQAVKSWTGGFAESAVASATGEVLEAGKVATCTANLSSARDYLNAFRRVGYQPFYRIHSFLGVKRGSGRFVDLRMSSSLDIRASSAARRRGRSGKGS